MFSPKRNYYEKMTISEELNILHTEFVLLGFQIKQVSIGQFLNHQIYGIYTIA